MRINDIDLPMLSSIKTINNYYVKGEQDKKAFNSIFKTLKDTQDNFEKASNPYLTLIEAKTFYPPVKKK